MGGLGWLAIRCDLRCCESVVVVADAHGSSVVRKKGRVKLEEVRR
jgi:hypothetical protein